MPEWMCCVFLSVSLATVPAVPEVDKGRETSLNCTRESADAKSARSIEGLGFFNLARGLGTVFVLWGHSLAVCLTKAEAVSAGLFSGAGRVFGGGIMALFFFISGYSFYQRSPRKCTSIQARLLLKPYCVAAVAILLTKVILAFVQHRSFLDYGGEYVLTFLLELNGVVGGTLAGMPVEAIRKFWFPHSLMHGWIIYNGILCLKRKRVQWALVAGCVVLGYGLTLISSIWPFCLHMSLMAVGFLAVGRQIRESKLLERQIPLWVYGLLALPVMISFAWGEVDMLAGVWKLGLLDVLSTFCLGFLMMRFYTWFNRKKRRGWPFRLFEAVGFNSMWVLCIHGYERVGMPWYLLRMWKPEQPLINSFLCLTGRSVLIFVLYCLLTWANRLWKGRKWNRKEKITLE